MAIDEPGASEVSRTKPANRAAANPSNDNRLLRTRRDLRAPRLPETGPHVKRALRSAPGRPGPRCYTAGRVGAGARRAHQTARSGRAGRGGAGDRRRPRGRHRPAADRLRPLPRHPRAALLLVAAPAPRAARARGRSRRCAASSPSWRSSSCSCSARSARSARSAPTTGRRSRSGISYTVEWWAAKGDRGRPVRCPRAGRTRKVLVALAGGHLPARAPVPFPGDHRAAHAGLPAVRVRRLPREARASAPPRIRAGFAGIPARLEPAAAVHLHQDADEPRRSA